MKVQQYNINTKAVGGKSIIEINLSSSVYRVSYIYIYMYNHKHKQINYLFYEGVA